MKNVVFPGDIICSSSELIKGHGTESHNGQITSTYFGTVKQINKLITVNPIFPSRYTPEIGDVVIGRVVHIFNKKWRIEINSKNDSNLSLSAINLPGVIQRRKSEEDEINMNKIFGIDDLLVCEVQKVSKNGNASLHTRNDKYGKLKNGTLIYISHNLLSPMKVRFLRFNDLEIIVGCNGFIWIQVHNETKEAYMKLAKMAKTIRSFVKNNEIIDLEAIANNI